MSRPAPLHGVVSRPTDEILRYRALGVYTADTLFALVERGRRARPNHPAIIAGSDRISYEELFQRAEARAASLSAIGIGPLDRVVVQLPNRAALVETLFALFRLGAIPIMALPGHRRAELSYFCDHTKAIAYITVQSHAGFSYAALGDALVKTCETLQHVLFADHDTPAEFLGIRAATIRAHAKTEMLQETQRLDRTALSETSFPEIDAGGVALLQLSGGSTGTPKLIPRTHEDYLYSVRKSAEVCGLTPESVYLAALPGTHNFPLSSPGILGCLWALGTVVLAPDPSPDTVFPLLTAERVTITAIVPALARAWLDAVESRGVSFPNLRVLQVGGARLDESLAQELLERFSCTLQQVFGMAEGLVNYTRLEDPPEISAKTQGKPMSEWDEVRIVDEDDYDVPDGTAGHLLTRGPYTIRGYYDAADHNARAFTEDGFYRTGDIVRRAQDGSLVVIGRAKEQINRAGEKIAPIELEEHLLQHDAVREVAVIGAPDQRLGEKIVVFVAPRANATVRKPDLIAFLRGRELATFKMPDQVVVVAALPRTNVGKIDKKALAQSLL